MTAGTPQGPYLYDDAPEPLYTGTPRRRRWLLLGVFATTVVLAVASVIILPMVRGSAEEQAREAAGVFLAALVKGDTETAYQLLCDAERARLRPDEVAPTYGRPGIGQVVGATAARHDGDPAQRVTVRWSGSGETTSLTVVNESGPHVCGTAPAA